MTVQPADSVMAYGFAFITDGFDGEPTRAQGYLAVCKAGDHCD